MNIEQIKEQLRRKAIVFDTGGIRPTNELGESWIGKVAWKLPNETWPIDEAGNKMIPLATIFPGDSDYVPKQLKGISLITIYLSNELLKNLGSEDYQEWFEINVYENLDDLVSCEHQSDVIDPFPLVPKFVDNEFPSWEDIEEDLFNIINDMENNDGIDYYGDIHEANYSKHKIGGYPSVIQSGVGYDEGFEFVLQISSDEKAHFNIVDSGNFYFGFNPQTKKWSVRCDFY